MIRASVKISMAEDAGANIAPSQFVAKLFFFFLFLLKKESPYKLSGCDTNFEGCTPKQLAAWTCSTR